MISAIANKGALMYRLTMLGTDFCSTEFCLGILPAKYSRLHISFSAPLRALATKTTVKMSLDSPPKRYILFKNLYLHVKIVNASGTAVTRRI
jgi:hypothetical protein